ncbi:MAG: hypothetical protein HY854_14305 [Burkholderiales bacterium]|nr:hypothetical protein [Burkholderiales bacterium]
MTTVRDSSGILRPDELKAIQSSVDAQYQGYDYSFRPAARFDRDMDVIRVIVEDVPFLEYRFTELLTVYVPTNLDGRGEDGNEVLNRPIGFALKGVAASDSIEDAEKLTKYLDTLAQKEDNLFVRTYIQRLLEPMAKNVDFEPAEAADTAH